MPGLKEILTAVKTSYLPALVLSGAVFYFCTKIRFQPGEYQPFHILFYFLILGNALFAAAVREVKPLFHLLWLTVLYLAAGNLSFHDGVEAWQQPEFRLLLFMLPLNWLYFTVWEDDRLNNEKNFYALCFVLLEMALAENSGHFVNMENFAGTDTVLLWEWGVVFLFLLLHASRDGNIKNAGIFFAFACLGMIFAGKSSMAAFSLFSSASALVLFLSSVHSYIYRFVRDELTGVYSRRMYHIHSRRSFPLKFSIGVICLDDYAKLVRVFGQKKVNRLIRMIVKKIQDLDTGAVLYRYHDDEFILVFKNEDKKQSYEYLETIRRAVAGAEFVLDRRQVVKVTISAGVSEKKRSDANVDVVLERTREVLQKAYKFTQNITSKA